MWFFSLYEYVTIGGVSTLNSVIYRGPKKWIILAPALIILVAMTIYPIFNVLIVSFQDWNLLKSPEPSGLIGFDNYTRAFQDPDFWNSVGVTLIFTIMSVSLSIIIAIAIALQLYPKGIYRTILKACLIFPYAISPALKGYTWRFMLNPHYGIIDKILGTLIPSLQDVVLLGTKSGALFWLAYTEIWGWAPFIALVFIGALDMIHPDVFAAAKIDGVNKYQMLRFVKIPLILPVLLMVTLLKTIFSVKVFDQILTLTNGGPGQSTEAINFFIYKNGFKFFEMGYASAQSVLLILFMIVFAGVYIKTVMKGDSNA